jgi:electron transfer flavoprotein beta subunit
LYKGSIVNIVVCIKQVPDTTNVRINPETNTLIREGVESIINPFDMYAIEESLRIREKHGGQVTIMSMGPPQVETALREAISLGADRAVLLSDRAFAGADTLATSLTLSYGIRRYEEETEKVDIVFMGKQAIDGDTGQVGPGVAEHMGIPHITDIRKIEEIAEEDGTITVERLLEDGYLRLKTSMPVVLTVVKEINEPRLPSLRGKMNAKKAEITKWTTEELKAAPELIGLNGSPTQVIKIFTPPKPQGGKVFTGETPDSVHDLLNELRENGLDLSQRGQE